MTVNTEHDAGNDLLWLLPAGIASELLKKLTPCSLRNMFSCSRSARDLVVQNCGQIVYMPGSTNHDVLEQAAQRLVDLSLVLDPRNVPTAEHEVWLASLLKRCLRSSLAGCPWRAVKTLTIRKQCQVRGQAAESAVGCACPGKRALGVGRARGSHGQLPCCCGLKSKARHFAVH